MGKQASFFCQNGKIYPLDAQGTQEAQGTQGIQGGPKGPKGPNPNKAKKAKKTLDLYMVLCVYSTMNKGIYNEY